MNIISLYSGAGGLDLGFEWEGFRPVVAYDIEPAAVETYNYNRGQEIARVADLSCISGDDIIRTVTQLSPGADPCGVIGGPPCQYFSNGNRTKRCGEDPRRMLPTKYAELLIDLNQQYALDFFVLENVKGMAKPAHRSDLDRVLEISEAAGFRVCWDVLDAYEYGVPQLRKHLFVVGWNREVYGDSEYEFPIGEPCGLTIRHCISELAEPQFWARDIDPCHFPEHPNHWTMRPLSEKFRKPPPPDLKRYTRSFRRLRWDEPSHAVAYGHNEIHVHPNGHRRLSIYEAMLLQGFPSGRYGYRLLGTLTKQVTMISDAVPPPLAAALARSIHSFMRKHRHNG